MSQLTVEKWLNFSPYQNGMTNISVSKVFTLLTSNEYSSTEIGSVILW